MNTEVYAITSLEDNGLLVVLLNLQFTEFSNFSDLT